MSGFRRICCAVDFSGSSRLALAEAARLALREGASLTVLHVRESPRPALEIPYAPPPAWQDEGAPPELEAWREEAERLREGPVDSVVLGQPVAPAITAFARETGVDLIVLSSHGRTGLARIAVGSVAESVVRTAPCPVLVVRARGGPGPPA
jgi:nucleotide-binding universal stress UspA family protein